MIVLAETSGWLLNAGVVLGGALGALALAAAAFFGLQLASQRVAAITSTTAKQSLAQPLFWVEVGLGSVLLLLFALIPYNTFGDDTKVMKDSGLTLVMVLAILLAVWSASVSIADELEGRTALTLLSKPISRRQFIVGKFLGVVGAVYLLFVILGVVLLAMIALKANLEARDLAQHGGGAGQIRQEMLEIVPGLVLAWFEAVVLASISVAISTRLPIVPNLVTCAAIYAIGHLVPLVVQSSAGKLPIVSFIGQLLATLLPVLDHFNVQAAVASGRGIPLEYLAWAGAYAALYCTAALLIALVLFEDRDLA
jgi:ABC-type transport system involved in multi-copper enzyme maturation permease subunit